MHNGSAAIEQRGGTLIVSASEFKRPGSQLEIGAAAKKTIFTSNIVAGMLNISRSENHKGKVAISNNLDDS